MASLPTGSRKYGTTYVQVLYRLDGGQTATWFHDHASVSKFRDLVNQAGPAKTSG